jgi:cytochrome c556
MSGLLKVVCVLLAAASLSACLEPAKDTHPNQVLTKRKALFKQFTRTLEPIGLVTSGRKDYNKEAFLADVQDLEKLSTKPWAYFPADGNYPPTHAKPTVWSQPAEFKRAQDQYLETVGELVKAAEAGDLDRIKGATTTVVNSCKACHRDFRVDY